MLPCLIQPHSVWNALALAAVPAFFAAYQAEDGDTVYLAGGTSEVGEVQDETFAGLAFNPEEGRTRVIPWSEVQGIEYADQPDAFASGFAALTSADYELARESFQSVLALEDLRSGVRQQSLFQLAGVQKRLGATEEAQVSYALLLSDFPQGRFVREAGEALIRMATSQGDSQAAEKVLADIAQGLSEVPEAASTIDLLEADLALAGGKAEEARQQYAALEGDATVGEQARLGLARALIQLDKAAEAEPILRELVAKSGAALVQSGAWNALGAIGAKEGRAQRDSARILDALYSYLRTVVQYRPLPGESTIEYQRALAGAATCFGYLSELESDPEKKRLWSERQREHDERLQREFPQTSLLREEG